MKTTYCTLLQTAGIIVLVFLFCSKALASDYTPAKEDDPCNVEADFTPAMDSILTPDTRLIRFENASINATSYKFIIDRSPYSLNTSVNYRFDAGIHTVQLVAYNGTCTDTITRHYFYAGVPSADLNSIKSYYGVTQTNQYVTDLKPGQDGGYFMAGYFANNTFSKYPNQSFLTKLDDVGRIIWTRTIKHPSPPEGRIKMIAPTADGGILVCGSHIPSYRASIIKLDKDGNVAWSRTFNCLGYGMGIIAVCEAEDGGVVALAGVYDQPEIAAFRLTASGDIRWGKIFRRTLIEPSRGLNILQRGNAVFICGTIPFDYESDVPVNGASVAKLDFNTGALQWWKNYRSPTGYVEGKDLSWIGNKILVNGNTPSVYGGKIVNAFFIIDTAGVVGPAFQTYAEVTSTNEYSRMHPTADGGFYIVNSGTIPPDNVLPGLQTRIVRHTVTIRLKPDFNVDWSYQHGESQYFYSANGSGNRLAILGEENGPLRNGSDYAWRPMLKTIEKTGPQPCGIWKDSAFTRSITMTPTQLEWIYADDITVNTESAAINFSDGYHANRFVCPTEFVDSCNYAVLEGPRTFCNTTTIYTYKLKRWKNCNQNVQWTIAGPASIISKNNNEIKLRFNTMGKYTLTALVDAPNGHSIDSIIATPGLVPLIPLNLGKDTVLCPNNSITLRASRHYLDYQWQDGSTGQKFLVTGPGTYWVKVTDLCGNELRDTIVVSLPPLTSVNAGPDLDKCEKDTINLISPPGYLSYSWSPSYNVVSVNQNNTLVNPQLDTSYILKAETMPGCFVYDTVKIKVHQSMAINLGPDMSLCEGSYLSLDAGPGFASYSWNTGESGRQIAAASTGQYSVVATSAYGCKSSDTLEILGVYDNPIVRLTGKPAICEGDTAILKAGNYAYYQWQDGSTSPQFIVKDAGTYYLTAFDNNGCAGSDTIKISMLLRPINFLPADTVICNGTNLDLQSNATFQSYSWNNGAVSSEITIGTPGTYWLQVTDDNNCTGRDSIIVRSKDCISGFNIPNAFTPNGDGLNDLFRPAIAGNISKYQFAVYDRQGKPVFTSAEPGKGWDGKIGGKDAVGSSYIWSCIYQVDGQPSKSETGTVLLIR